MTFEELLDLQGLSVATLDALSYESHLPFSLKEDLGDVDKDALLEELKNYSDWISTKAPITSLLLDYRVKSYQSILAKYERYYPNREIRKVFNDVLGFRGLCDDYKGILSIKDNRVHIVDLTSGKEIDDGYRGVHLSYRRGPLYYPIELQFNTFYDRQFNNYLHDYLYKKDYPKQIGGVLRKLYETGKIKDGEEFKEALEYVLHSGS